MGAVRYNRGRNELKRRTDMNRIVQSVKDLCALTGSFVMPTGEAEKTEDGYCYAGEG